MVAELGKYIHLYKITYTRIILLNIYKYKNYFYYTHVYV